MTTLEPAKVIAVVDNDQCIGDWRPLGAMYVFVFLYTPALQAASGDPNLEAFRRQLEGLL